MVNSLDLFRLSKSKKVADLSPNTIRKYSESYGLRIYYTGGTAWVSRSELEAVIRANAKSSPTPRQKRSTPSPSPLAQAA